MTVLDYSLIIAGEPRHQNLEAAGHILFIEGESNECVYTSGVFASCLVTPSGIPCLGNGTKQDGLLFKGLPVLSHAQKLPAPWGSRLCQVYRTVATVLAVIWTRVRLSQENRGSGSRCSPRPRVFVVHTCNLSSQEVKHEDYPWVQSQQVSVSLVYRVPDQAGLPSKVLFQQQKG